MDPVWEDLDRPGQGPGLAVRRLHPDTAHDLFAAVEHPAGRRLLIYEPPVPVDTPAPVPESTRALDLRLVPAAAGTAAGGRWELALTEPGYGDVFSALVTDVAGAVAAAPDARAATAALLERFGHWRRLFQDAAGEGLSVQQRRGLFGELWFLREEMLPRLHPSEAVGSWSGPVRAHQDFQLPAVAVEVKTTTAKEPQELVITNERELDGVGVAHLLLAHLSVDERPEGDGESLNEMVDALTAVLTDPDTRRTFEDRLTAAGYWHRHRHRYHSPRFTLRRQRLYEVREGFPRIVETELRPGVGDVRYRVSAAACQPFLVPHDTLDGYLTGRAA